MSSKEKPYVILVAELIYLKISEIKKKNPEFTNINAIEAFIGTKTYKEISNGEFHNKLIILQILKIKRKSLKKQLNYYIFKKT